MSDNPFDERAAREEIVERQVKSTSLSCHKLISLLWTDVISQHARGQVKPTASLCDVMR